MRGESIPDALELMRRSIGHFDVLLIEDSLPDARLMQVLVREVPKCRLHVASDGEEALDFLHHSGSRRGTPLPRLIILDWNLPGRSGEQVLERIKKEPRFQAIPVIVLSGSSSREAVSRAYDLYASGWVTKGPDLSEHARRIRTLIDFWSRTAELPRSPGE